MIAGRTKPFFSVVLANYNGEAYLREALDSVLSQTYDDYEFIVVDDGSTDESPTIFREYADSHPGRVRPLLKERNEGQGVSFNRGVEMASGEYVSFIDSDDVWLPEKLANTARQIDRSRSSTVYQHNLYKWRHNEKTTERFRALISSGDFWGYTQQTGVFPLFCPTSALTFPRQLLAKVMPIPDGFRTCADGYLTRTSFVHGPVSSVDECWGYYRIHGSNNVFANPAHKSEDYRYKLLIPALNAYYAKMGISYRFGSNPLMEKIKDASPRLLVRFARRQMRRMKRS